MVASKCATTLTQRGYDNVFMLSGGIRVAANKYPNSLVIDREIDRLEEGDIMVLENLLEENIAMGSSSRMSISGSRVSSVRQGPGTMRNLQFDAPARTSTALGTR